MASDDTVHQSVRFLGVIPPRTMRPASASRTSSTPVKIRRATRSPVWLSFTTIVVVNLPALRWEA